LGSHDKSPPHTTSLYLARQAARSHEQSLPPTKAQTKTRGAIPVCEHLYHNTWGPVPNAIERPIRRTREGGSEWEPIKIILEGDEGSNKTNTASNTRLRLTTQIGQVHVATGVLLNLGPNLQPHRPENTAEHQPRIH
jgi:hypothetical protein